MSAYRLPSKLEPYREMIESVAGGNTVEYMMAKLEDKNLVKSNLFVWTMAIQVETIICTLTTLQQKGLLK